jgi:hypothetical protein
MGPFHRLHLLPIGLLLVQRQRRKARAGKRLHRLESPFELGVAGTQRGFGINAVAAGKIGQHKQHIAQFLGAVFGR